MGNTMLHHLFEIENIKHTLMKFGPGVELKIIVLLGNKDKNGNKKRYLEEYRYPSSKYGNTDHLVSVVENFDTILAIEYPGNNDMDSIIYLRDYMLSGLLDKINEFDAHVMDPFSINQNTKEILLNSSRVTPITSFPSQGTSIHFCQDIYVDQNNQSTDCGVRITFNNEFSITVRMITVWKRFVYIMNQCNLFLWGCAIAQPYFMQLPGTAITEFDRKQYNSSSRYVPIQENPEDIINNPELFQPQRMNASDVDDLFKGNR